MQQDKNIHIFFNINHNYTYITAVCLSSILCNANKDYKLSFYILSKDLKEKDKEKLSSLRYIKDYNIEFIDINESIFKTKLQYIEYHISFEANYRLLISSLKPNLDKCIYLDVDLIVLQDISKLWEIDISDYYMAAVIDQASLSFKNDFSYITLPKNYTYINSGVMLCNIKKWREDDIEKKLFENFEKYSKVLKFPDQDTLNITLHSKIKYLDLSYNAMPVQRYLNEDMRKQAFKDPKIVHWAGFEKPWLYSYVGYKDEFLNYARKLSFYDEFLYKHTKLIDKECLESLEEKNKSLNELKADADVCICTTFDYRYAVYFAALLRSILEHTNSKTKYEIVVLYNNDLNKTYMQKITSMIEQDNVSIKFVDVFLFICDMKEKCDLFTYGHFSDNTYYRFLIPTLFKDYEKVLYIDTDTIVLKDLKELYDVDLEDKFIAAVKDIEIRKLVKDDKKFKQYTIEELGMQSEEDYFNAGILLFDIKKFKEIDFLNLCLEKLKELKKPKIVDQCVLNSILYKKVKFISLRWNYLWNTNIKNKNLNRIFNDNFYEEFKDAFENHYIIHYCDHFKPWNSPHLEKADIWWSYARKTPFYEEILYRHLSNPYKAGAKNQIQSHLSYKLGQELMSVKTNKAKILLLPLSLIFIYMAHLLSRVLNNLLAYSNASIRPEPLWNYYSDYHEALNIKNKQLTYRLGNLLVKHPFTFIFRANKVYKEWKREKEE